MHCPEAANTAFATGKILKRVLREPYWRGRERRIN